jgi:tryptophan synthase alpha chain
VVSPLDELFARTRAEHRAALIGYLPAGFPSHAGAVAAMTAMVAAGVDAVEVGLPYSDPLMDGPTIAAAVDVALAGGTRTVDVLRTVAEVAATGAPTLVMTYWNPVERYGARRFAADLRGAGGAGAITPDLPPEEATEWLAAAEEAGIDPVFLVAPSSKDERIARVASVSRGFLYAASTMGVTGARASMGERAADLVTRARRHTDLPIAVGLGVSTGAQAAEVAGYADGVIVGSAFVRRLLDAPDEAAGVRAVTELAAELAMGARRT